LEAVVSVAEVQWFNGEKHTSHPISGRFDHGLPCEGTHQFEFSANGYHPKTVELEVGREWKRVRVEMARVAQR
jgi:hypothetical protein